MLALAKRSDFDDYLDLIRSERLRAIAKHWDLARAPGRMPSFRGLRPSGIAPQLPIIWVYSYDRATQEFTGRLAGDRITHAFGKNFRGAKLKDLHPPELLDIIQDHMQRLVEGPMLYHSCGRLFRRGAREGVGERIMMPLADDGIHGDGLLGASDYDFPAPDVLRAPVELIGENITWLPLN